MFYAEHIQFHTFSPLAASAGACRHLVLVGSLGAVYSSSISYANHVRRTMPKAVITGWMWVEEERHTALESRLLAARASCFLGAHALAVITSAAGHCCRW